MRVRFHLIWLVLAAAALVAGFLATLPTSYLAAAVAGVVVLWCVLKSGLWRTVFAVTLILMASAASHVDALLAVSYYGRYVAAGVLVVLTWVAPMRRPLKRSGPWLRRLVGALWVTTIFALASTFWSVVPGLTALQAVAMLFLAAFTQGVVTRRWADPHVLTGDIGVITIVLATTLGAGFAMAAVGMQARLPPDYRLRGFYDNPNQTAMMALIVVTLTWGLWQQNRRPWFLLALLVGAVGLVTTEARTSIVATLAAIAFVVVRRGNARRYMRLAGAGIAGWLFIFVALPWIGYGSAARTFEDAYARFFAHQGGGLLNGRGLIWAQTLEYWRASPFVGQGFRSGEALFAADPLQVNVSHNSYLQALVELGLLGALPVLVMLICLAVALVRAPLDGIGAGLGACVAGCLLVQLTESAIFGTGQPFPWVLWPVAAALVASLDRSPAGGQLTAAPGQATQKRAPSPEGKRARVRVGRGSASPAPGPQHGETSFHGLGESRDLSGHA